MSGNIWHWTRIEMKTLYLLRHAKSSWDDRSLTDFGRPLNERGLKTAPFVGALMTERGLIPDVVISSPAARAKETARLILEKAGMDVEIAFDERIYEASPQTLLAVVSAIDGHNTSAMIVGHNPGIEGFIWYLTGTLQPMPTAALAVIELKIDRWAETREGGAEVRNIIRPKDEMKKTDGE